MDYLHANLSTGKLHPLNRSIVLWLIISGILIKIQRIMLEESTRWKCFRFSLDTPSNPERIYKTYFSFYPYVNILEIMRKSAASPGKLFNNRVSNIYICKTLCSGPRTVAFKFDMYQNHLEGLLKRILLDPALRSGIGVKHLLFWLVPRWCSGCRFGEHKLKTTI